MNLRLQWAKGGGEGEFGMDTYTLLCLKWITNKDPLCGTWNSAHVMRQSGWEGRLGRMDTCIYLGGWIHVYTGEDGYMYTCVAGASWWPRWYTPAMQETQAQSPGWEETLGKEMVTHSSILPGEFHRQRSLMSCSPPGQTPRSD